MTAIGGLNAGSGPGPGVDPALPGVQQFMHRRPRWALRLALVWVLSLLLLAIVVSWLPLHDYTTIVGGPNVGPNFSHEFFGTDDIGRSMVSRLAYGARVSVIISFTSTAIAAVIGGLLGLLAAYFRGVVSVGADTVANSVLSVPPLLLILTIILVFTPSVVTITAAISIIFIPAFMRLMRANALSQMSREYILAARSLGATRRRIIARELLPNSAPQLLTYAVVVLPSIIIVEGALSFLGFGVPSPTPSWGGMISLGAQSLTTDPWQAFIPCAVLSLTVFSLNVVGDQIRSRLDLRESHLQS